MSKKEGPLKTGKFGRMVKLGQGLVRASAQLSSPKKRAALEAKLAAAQELASMMGQMKGGLMKMGQMISISGDLILPAEVSRVFQSLQNMATPMAESQMRSVFSQSFGKAPEEIFLDFGLSPLAQASIGQVHWGMIGKKDAEGRDSKQKVAIKVQYPGIQQAIRSDLSNLDAVKKLILAFVDSSFEVDHFLQEIAASILKECDYQLELQATRDFKRDLEGEFPGQIKVPQVYPEYSNSVILTQEYCYGDSFEFALENYTQAQKDELGRILYESTLYCLFSVGGIHSDPQYGNYLFRPNKVIMLDFGSIKKFDQQFLLDYCAILMAIEEDKLQLFKYAACNLHLIYPDEDPEEVEKFFRLGQKVYAPLLKAGAHSLGDFDPFTFFRDYLKGVDLGQRRSPKADFLFLDRTLFGLFTKVRQLRARVDWQQGRERYRAPLEKKLLGLSPYREFLTG